MAKSLVIFLVFRQASGFFLERGKLEQNWFSLAHRTIGVTTKESSTASLKVVSDDMGEPISYIPAMRKNTELWLDLRGSATHPKAAVQYILDELEEDALLLPSDRDGLIEKVIMSDSSFQSLVNTSDPFVSTSEILYQPEGTVDGYVALSRNGLSLPFGAAVCMPSDSAIAVRNPVEAMKMLGDGRWVLLQNDVRGTDPCNELLHIDAIGSFLDIASTASTQKWDTSTGQDDEREAKLILKGDVSVTAQQRIRGGVAVSCSSKSFFIQLASMFESFQSASSTTVTESGIIIHGVSDFSAPKLPTALILPFDTSIWRAATIMYGCSHFHRLFD